jgi:phenylalanyl-tRNA synthetase alpha chain
MQDTFYISHEPRSDGDQLVLRTQTSSGQIRFMKQHKPPFAIIIPGRVYRNEATDATHEHTFLQMEGLVVGKNITYGNMVWTLQQVLKKFFGDDAQTKLLPSYFPFVEPGAEMAISSPKFKDGKWVEILGCGMVHQNVFEAVGYERHEYSGFAFGFGLTRFALMKYGIPDIRLLAENHLQFLKQF